MSQCFIPSADSGLELSRCIIPHVVRGDLKEARSNLVVTFAAIKLQGPRFKPWLGQNFVVILDGELRMNEDTIYKVGH